MRQYFSSRIRTFIVCYTGKYAGIQEVSISSLVENNYRLLLESLVRTFTGTCKWFKPSNNK